MAFTHLHLHTEYSLLDGAARIDRLVKRAKELGMDSLAITDHGAMFGVIEFYKECKRQGIKPVIGCEVYMAANSRLDKEKERTHLVLLAENNEGYQNLIRLVSLSYEEGYYYKPRIDKEILRKYNSGLIGTSACLAGKVQRELLDNNFEGAKREALEMEEILGKGNFFLELQDHGLREDRKVTKGVVRLSEETGIPLVATNDVHYINKEDSTLQEVLLAVQTGKKLGENTGMAFETEEFYLKSEEEMKRLFSYAPEAIENTAKIAQRCNVEFTFGDYHLPEFNPPEGFTNYEYLKKLCFDGLEKRYGISREKVENPETADKEQQQLIERLDYEIDTISSMGYVEYFLIVWDFIHFAKNNGIMVGPGRGSAVGSIVSYCLEITNVDPIKYGLIFERFLNPERISMPDIDIDFCIERRGDVIEYVKRKYGKENVSQIITFGRMMPRLAIRDVGRVMDINFGLVDRVAKTIPASPGMNFSKALEISPDFKAFYEGGGEVRKMIELAMGLEGLPRHAGTHAAGVVISKKPVYEYVPLYVYDGAAATQFVKDEVEELGLLKMDFLGLRNLTVIRNALSMIEKNHGKHIDFSTMGYDDPAVYEMISEGNTAGVFQLESGGMTSFMKQLRPTCFEDVVAGIALYRPGPMDSIPDYIENKKHPEKISYVTPELAHILDVTYGCLIYQEQVMQIVRDLAGFSYGRSDLVRRAMSKKKTAEMLKEKENFINGKVDKDGNVEIPGCIRNGISRESAEAIFAEMESFASYAFNKSHAAAYAVLAFQTGYLKKYYPVEFMAALITSVAGESGGIKVASYIRNCKDMGIDVLPPDVNKSFKGFSVEDGKIRFGLEAVKNVGDNAIETIIEAREERMPEDFFQFIDGFDISKINKKAVESLISAGATDCLEKNRAALLAVYEELLEGRQNSARKNLKGQMNMFDFVQGEDREEIHMELPDIRNFDENVLLSMEKEMTGIYISGHPMEQYKEKIDKFADAEVEEIITAAEEMAKNGTVDSRFADGTVHKTAGLIRNVKEIMTKRGDLMAFVQLEGMTAGLEVVAFPEIYKKSRAELVEDACVIIKGKLQYREDTPQMIADIIIGINSAEECGGLKDGGIVKIMIPKNVNQADMLYMLDNIFEAHRGEYKVLLYLQNGKIVGMQKGKGVAPDAGFVNDMNKLVGPGNFKIEEE